MKHLHKLLFAPVIVCLNHLRALCLILCCMTPAAGLASPPDSWAPVALPFSGSHAIAAMWGASSTDIYAVGEDGANTLIFHFDGASWTLVPDVRGPGAFYAVWGSSPTDVFAVGSAGLVYHFDGTNWSPQDSHTSAHLRGVWGTGPNDVYAVGGSGSGAVVHYDGTGWADITSTLPVNHQFEEIWGTGSSCINIVGGYGSTGVLHFNGIDWIIIPAPAVFLTGIWGRSCDDFYAVGHQGSDAAGIFYHCNETSCTQICTGLFGSLAQVPQLWAVMGIGPAVYAVGISGTMANWDGATCTPLSTGTTDFLSSIWAIAPCDIYAAGNNVMLHSVCSFQTACDPNATWKNHGQYVRCVAHEVEQLVSTGVITRDQGDEMITAAAQSNVGKFETCPNPVVSIDNFRVPAIYDNINSDYSPTQITGGQTFIATDGLFRGVRLYIADPNRMNEPNVGPLDGPAELVLYDAENLERPVLKGGETVVADGVAKQGEVDLILREPIPTVVGHRYFFGVRTRDNWGVGLTDPYNPTYPGGAESFLDESTGAIRDLSFEGGRDLSFLIYSNCGIP